MASQIRKGLQQPGRGARPQQPLSWRSEPPPVSPLRPSFPRDAAVRLAPAWGWPAGARGWRRWASCPRPVTRVPTRSYRTGCWDRPGAPPPRLAWPPAAPWASRRQRCPRLRSPARVVSVRSWLAAPRGNSLSFRPLRLSTPVTAASSSARSMERLHETGPGPGPAPELEPPLAPERLAPDAAGPEYSTAAATATSPAAAISQPRNLRLAGAAHARAERLGGRGKRPAEPERFPAGRGCGPPARLPALASAHQGSKGNKTDPTPREQPLL